MTFFSLVEYPLAAAALAPIFLHLFMWGWVTQLIFGVVYWMFPKHSRQQPRSSEALWVVTFWSFNIGLLLRLIGEPLHLLRPEALWAWLAVLAALLQWLAAMVFVVNSWGRVKGR